MIEVCSDRHIDPKDLPGVRHLTLQEYNLLQIQHIMKHKWYLSEETGKELTFNEACADWQESGLAAEFRKYFRVKMHSRRIYLD
jgi:hypothetical protein